MSRLLPRLRGALLRLLRRRRLAIAVGVLLIAPSAWVEWSGAYGPWATGAALVVGATGLALLWHGLVGASPDWIE